LHGRRGDGLEREQVVPVEGRRALLRAAPARLTYVSCDAATLVRDLGELTRDFDLESITFLDIFPQTAHLETVVQLWRRG